MSEDYHVEAMRSQESKPLFRAINRAISRQATFGSASPSEMRDFVCECPDPDCVATAAVSVPEFDAICADETLVLVGPGHSAGGRERLVRATSRFGVIRRS